MSNQFRVRPQNELPKVPFFKDVEMDVNSLPTRINDSLPSHGEVDMAAQIRHASSLSAGVDEMLQRAQASGSDLPLRLRQEMSILATNPNPLAQGLDHGMSTVLDTYASLPPSADMCPAEDIPGMTPRQVLEAVHGMR
ncbi:hypothetical protein KIPB_012447 [Kipferlia bialata]|uniref:Uncharacterized protein n=1 Tax=Kipferlia bialata TaxID=797122 RepID=A0A9K3D650_9EUKA|nr:hypothetical protein KIPB_012447 [Kipferlia bialata]|eukprot:g12447.t1